MFWNTTKIQTVYEWIFFYVKTTPYLRENNPAPDFPLIRVVRFPYPLRSCHVLLLICRLLGIRRDLRWEARIIVAPRKQLTTTVLHVSPQT